MRPRIIESDVEAMDGDQDVDELHDVFASDFLDIRRAKKQIPDWLEEQNPDDYEARVNYHTYHKHMQGGMAEWLSTIDAETISSDRVREKYKELKQEFQSENPGVTPDKTNPSW